MGNDTIKKDKKGHVLDAIWKESQLEYLSDIADIRNQQIVYRAVSNISEREYLSSQWEEAYQYIFRNNKQVGNSKENILRELQK